MADKCHVPDCGVEEREASEQWFHNGIYPKFAHDMGFHLVQYEAVKLYKCSKCGHMFCVSHISVGGILKPRLCVECQKS